MADENKENKVKVEETKKVESKPEFKKVEDKKVENKKVEDKKVNNVSKASAENKKGNTYWIIGVLIVLLIIVVITLLVVLPSTPSKTVNGMLDALKSGDFTKAEEYVNYKELMNSSELSNGEDLDIETQKLIFNKLSWKINKVTEENETASIEVEVTNKDFKTIISNYVQKAIKVAFGSGTNDEEIENYLLEELKNENVQLATVTKTLTALKQDGKWRVEINEELLEVLFPGLSEAINALSSNVNM